MQVDELVAKVKELVEAVVGKEKVEKDGKEEKNGSGSERGSREGGGKEQGGRMPLQVSSV